jgi:hypothetical protein
MSGCVAVSLVVYSSCLEHARCDVAARHSFMAMTELAL